VKEPRLAGRNRNPDCASVFLPFLAANGLGEVSKLQISPIRYVDPQLRPRSLSFPLLALRTVFRDLEQSFSGTSHSVFVYTWPCARNFKPNYLLFRALSTPIDSPCGSCQVEESGSSVEALEWRKALMRESAPHLFRVVTVSPSAATCDGEVGAKATRNGTCLPPLLFEGPPWPKRPPGRSG